MRTGPIPGDGRIPRDDEIRALHERYAPTPEAFENVYSHCVIVWRVAEQLLTGAGASHGMADVDADLVRAGCLLHDVGVYRLFDDAGLLDYARYMRHGVLGYELLAEAGYPEAICRFASRHTGVGITREDVIRQELPLPPADYVAETPEEALVMYADKFHTKATPPSFLSAEFYAAYVRRFGAEKVTAFDELRGRFGEPDLGPLSAAYGQPVRESFTPIVAGRPRG
jgi:uncharacterized protein